MSPLRISFLLILLASFTQVDAATAARPKVTITTFNIRFYGLYGAAEEKKDAKAKSVIKEERDPYLKEFLKNSIPVSDFFVFQEIVDVPRLKKLLPSGWGCVSYDNPSPSHQHVVLCHSPKYAFVREPSDDNYLIDEVSGERGTLRPAVTAIVTDLNGNKLFRLVGVHLKASPEYSELRLEQSAIIAEYLGQLKSSKLPVVITGDYNTYPVAQNGQTVDDTKLILRKLNESGLNMKRIPNDLFTFRSIRGYVGQFDHFYLSNSLTATKPLRIFETCNDDITAEELEVYYKTISDHCPVSAEIAL